MKKDVNRMPRCPECGTEYVEGITECADCGVPLVDRSGGKTEAEEPEGIISNASTGEEVFLCNLSGPIEISYITSVLEEEGIPYLMTNSDPGLYLEALMGSSFMGKDIYVGKDDLKRAAEIVESFRAEVLSENEPEDE